MIKYRLLLAALIFVFIFPLMGMPFDVSADCGQTYLFVLTRGNPFFSMSLKAKMNDVKLKFMDRLWCIKKADSSSEGSEVEWFICEKGDRQFFLPGRFLYSPKMQRFSIDEDGNIEIGSARINKYFGIPLDYTPNDLVAVEGRYKAMGYKWRSMKLREEAYRMFKALIDDAEKNGVIIKVISAFRDSRYQAGLYTRAIKRHGLFQNSVAKPGHSEHQLGTACDLTSPEIAYRLSENFQYTSAYLWLMQNSWRYGIFLTYPKNKQYVTGYTYEPWHFRYWGKDHWKKLFYNFNIELR